MQPLDAQKARFPLLFRRCSLPIEDGLRVPHTLFSRPSGSVFPPRAWELCHAASKGQSKFLFHTILGPAEPQR